MRLLDRRLARPYAQAAFELAERTQSHAVWREGLIALASLTQDKTICAILKDVRLSGQRGAELVLALMALGKSPLSLALQNLVRLLSERRQLLLCAQIQAFFEELSQARLGIAQVFLTSATPLTQATKAAAVKTLTAQTGRTVEIAYNVDPTLLGGMVIHIGEQLFDHSFKGYLSQLKEALGHSYGIRFF